MLDSTVRFAWREPRAADEYHTGVCLHGHTMHSQECLSFLPRHLHLVPGISQLVRHYETVRGVDFGRAWWTPPLSPASALSLEREQIAKLGLQQIVSLTDHDDIEAGLTLGVTNSHAQTPVSVEWTVPYRRSIFHLGIHNVPVAHARQWMKAMAEFTAAPREEALPSMLAEFSRLDGVLIVLNHPYWLEEGVIEQDHRIALDEVLRACITWFHALELNGTRPWKENADTIALARSWNRPVISGGDRHACEPSACINLTRAASFAEFAAEIRDGASSILFLPQYREPMAQRILEAARDIVGAYPEYPGRERWPDRIFYRDTEGVVRTMAQICQGREPRLVAGAIALLQFFGGGRLRMALRMLNTERGEMLP